MSGAAPSAIRRGYVDAAEGQLHYREAGAGRPIVLLHPGPASGAMFDPVLPLLAQAGRRAIAFDVPGYGQSFHPREPSMEGYASAIQDGIDALGIDGFDLFGNHGGATVALLLADAAPARVGRIILWGKGIGDDNYTPSPAGNTLPFGSFARDGSDLARFWASGFNFTNMPDPDAFALRRMSDLLLAGYDNPGHGPGDRVDHRSLLKRVATPTLVMSGHHDEVWNESQVAATLMPDARFEAIEAGSVYVAEEYPERLAAAILAFLAAA